jgi:hypothetical protein
MSARGALAVLLAIGLGSGLSCGSRTGLDASGEVALSSEHDGSLTNEAGSPPDGQAPKVEAGDDEAAQPTACLPCVESSSHEATCSSGAPVCWDEAAGGWQWCSNQMPLPAFSAGWCLWSSGLASTAEACTVHSICVGSRTGAACRGGPDDRAVACGPIACADGCTCLCDAICSCK